MVSQSLTRWKIVWIVTGTLIFVVGCSSTETIPTITIQATIETVGATMTSSVAEIAEHEASATPTSIPVLPDCPDGLIIFSSEENEETQHFATCSDGASFVQTVPDYEQYDPDYSSEHGFNLRISGDGHVLILENASGQEIRCLVDDPQLDLIDASLSFDGKYVAYGFVDSNLLAYGLQVIDLENDVSSTLFAPDDTKDISIFSINWIRWSPINRKLLIYGGTVPMQILSIECEMDTHICQGMIEGQPGKFTDQYTANPWSPDGTLIAYPCYTATSVNGAVVSSHGLCVQDAWGENLRDFPEEHLGVSNISSLRWSPDSNRVIFTGYAQGHSDSDIFIFDVVSETLLNLTEQIPGNQNSALWLP